MAKKKAEKSQSIWNSLWEQYKKEWKKLWEQYKSLIIPFIEGTAKYIWQLVYGLIKLLVVGLYKTLKFYFKKLIDLIKKA